MSFFICVPRRKKENISNMRVLFYYILLHISWLPNAYTHRRRGGTKRGWRGRQTVLGLKVGSFRARVLATSCARPEHVQRISVSADKRAHLWIGLDSLPVCPSVCVRVCVYSCPSHCLCVCFLLTKCFDFHWKTGWRTTRLSASSTNLLSCLQARPLLLSLSLPLLSSLSFSFYFCFFCFFNSFYLLKHERRIFCCKQIQIRRQTHTQTHMQSYRYSWEIIKAQYTSMCEGKTADVFSFPSFFCYFRRKNQPQNVEMKSWRFLLKWHKVSAKLINVSCFWSQSLK